MAKAQSDSDLTNRFAVSIVIYELRKGYSLQAWDKVMGQIFEDSEITEREHDQRRRNAISKEILRDGYEAVAVRHVWCEQALREKFAHLGDVT